MSSKKKPRDEKNNPANSDFTPLSAEELLQQSPPDVTPDNQHSGPLSGASVVSWAELLKSKSGDGSGFNMDVPSNIVPGVSSEKSLFGRPIPQETPKSEADESESDADHITSDVPSDEFQIPFFPGQSSRVDLASQPEIHIPFPVSEDDFYIESMTKSPTTDVPWPEDSGRVDLIGPNGPVSPSGITTVESGRRRRPAGADTVKMHQEKNRALVNGLIGGGVGLVVCAVMWAAGIRPGASAATVTPQPIEAAIKPTDELFDSALRLLQAGDFDRAVTAFSESEKNGNLHAGGIKTLVIKSRTDSEQIKKLEADFATLRESIKDNKTNTVVAALTAQLDSAKSDIKAANEKAQSAIKVADKADETLKAHDAKFASIVKDAEARATQASEAKKASDAELKKIRDQFTQIKTTPATDSPDVTQLKADQEQLTRKVKSLDEKLAESAQQREAFQRTQQEMNGLLRELRQKAQTPSAKVEVSVPMVEATDPRGEQAFAKGLSAFRNGEMTQAESEFNAAIRANQNDARYWYFRGLNRIAMGMNYEGRADLKQGSQLERQNQPNPQVMDRLMERMPLDTRNLVSQARIGN